MSDSVLLQVIGEGSLYLGGSGQGADFLGKTALARSVLPLRGADTGHLTRLDGTDFFQWYGRRHDGRFHPYGPIFALTAEGRAEWRSRNPKSPLIHDVMNKGEDDDE